MGRRKIEDEDDDIAVPGDPERKRVLDELGLMTEAELCLLFECGVKTLKNRTASELPPYFKAGHKRLFFREDVIKYFRQRTNDG